MNVLVIPEDFRNDQYILRPIIEAMLRHRGIPSKVQILTDPLLGGLDEALKQENLQTVFDEYQGMIDLFILCVDRDCDANRHQRLQGIEAFAAEQLPAGKRLIASLAMEELEVWPLAAVTPLPAGWGWQAILNECNPKEVYFDEYARQQGLLRTLGGGRKMLGLEAARNYQRVRQLCNRDVGSLEARI